MDTWTVCVSETRGSLLEWNHSPARHFPGTAPTLPRGPWGKSKVHLQGDLQTVRFYPNETSLKGEMRFSRPREPPVLGSLRHRLFCRLPGWLNALRVYILSLSPCWPNVSSSENLIQEKAHLLRKNNIRAISWCLWCASCFTQLQQWDYFLCCSYEELKLRVFKLWILGHTVCHWLRIQTLVTQNPKPTPSLPCQSCQLLITESLAFLLSH